MILIMIWWFVSAHKWFKGPHVNVEHAMYGHNDVVDGVEEPESSSDGMSDGKGKKVDSPAPNEPVHEVAA